MKDHKDKNYVWDNNKATYFIESILIGTEVPPLIFFDNNKIFSLINYYIKKTQNHRAE